MRHIAAQSAVYTRTENTALPGSRRLTPRHNISAYVSWRMQMPDRDIAAQSNGIIYSLPPKASPDTENYAKTPLKSEIKQASKRFCSPHTITLRPCTQDNLPKTHTHPNRRSSAYCTGQTAYIRKKNVRHIPDIQPSNSKAVASPR